MEESACYIETGIRTAKAGSRNFLLVRGLTVAACCGSVIALAWWLTPDSTGAGTHRQLGLPVCSFLVRTGYPCPTCGMTTSVSAMTHGKFVLAFRSHPFGVVLFAGLVVLTATATYEALTGKNALSRLGKPAWWVWTFIIGIPAGWVLKLIWGIASGALPV
ncbi:MAG: DUF2752 domain-containing protein [Planctomycetota bacterium]|nr:DUF2752 domain-containing protein [Planctomycetota bacterium]